MFNVRRAHLIPIIGFAIIIFLGTVFLKLPMSNNSEISTKDALFMAISASTCTGFSRVVVSEHFTFIGQLVLTILMEIGSFGFIAFVAFYWVKRKRRIKLSNILLIDDTYSNDEASTVREYVLFLISIMLKVQLIGFVLLAFKFVPEYGIFDGIWNSIFQTIAAFANSGLDNLGTTSLIKYNTDPYVQLVIIFLMVSGSIGIFALHDIEVNKLENMKKFKLETKIILTYTIFLLVVPTLLMKLFDSNISIINALFMAASSRSSGLFVLQAVNLSVFSRYILIVLMFIGGSPSSTAGGIRVVAIAVIISTVLSTLRGKKETIMFWKKIPEEVVRKAFTEFFIFIMILIISIMIFDNYSENLDLLNIIFECVSAITNTGLTITSQADLTLINDVIIMSLMVIGRVGPLSLILIFINNQDDKKLVSYPEEHIIL